MVEIRELNDGDIGASMHVAAQAYRRGNLGDGVPRPFGPGSTTYGLFEQGQLVAQFRLWHYQIYFGERRTPMGGVAAVACLPLARGRGHTRALLQHGLEQMRERGQAVSMLHAFLVSLYRPLGWEWVGSSRQYTVPLAAIPRGLDSQSVRAATPADAEALRQLYDADAARYRGMLVRSLSWWQEKLDTTAGHMPYFFLYERDQPEGYLYFTLQDTPTIREFVARTPDAYAGLLGALRLHKSQFEKFTWEAPPDDPLWHYAAHWDLKVTWEPPYSARIVDLPAAAKLLSPPEGLAGRCVVQIEDPVASWNHGVWEIAVEGGQMTATPSTAEPQVACDIGAWSQLSFGDPEIGSLRRAGRIAVSDERGYEMLKALCPPALCWTNDYF